MTDKLDFAGAVTALHRFGHGARGLGSGDLRSAARDPRGFVRAELERPGGALLESPGLPDLPAFAGIAYRDQQEQKARRELAARQEAARMQGDRPNPMAQEMQAQAPAAPIAQKPPASPEQDASRAEALACLRRAAQAPCGITERLVAFWSNHFAVSIFKGTPLHLAAGIFEREAIRPHVFGRFADMLLAVEQHPVMLQFLDNPQSVGPHSRAGQNGRRGLNENLAREIMELHTLGVGGGYSQADVTSLAAIITGWTVRPLDGRNGPPGEFVFDPARHEPGSRTLLGRVFPEAGVGQGEDALRELARHPSTARFIATKFARHFVADDSPPALVARLAGVFTARDGDLGAFTRALLDSDEAWQAPLTKLRAPRDFVIAATRLFGRIPEEPNALLGAMNQLGQPLWSPPGPNGYADQAAAWLAPQAMKLRLDVAAQMAQRAQTIATSPVDLLDDVLGPVASRETRETVARAESKPQAFALLLMSPEFQRR